jgi:hypothetical protein
MRSAGTLDFSRADFMAAAPSLGAETLVKAPLNCYTVSLALMSNQSVSIRTTPTGVRDAAKMYASFCGECEHVKERCEMV